MLRNLVGALACFVSCHASAGSVTLGDGMYLAVDAASYEDTKFSTVVRQQRDYSCGSAALATLLTFHYDQPVSENDVFIGMYDPGDQARIRMAGFSLLDMKTYLAARQMNADGFHLTLDALAALAVPAIALINTGEYAHFVVIKGISGQKVLIGDPAVGLKMLDRVRFEKDWNGIAFLIRDRANTARANFNRDTLRLRHDYVSSAISLHRPSLASFTLTLPRLGDF